MVDAVSFTFSLDEHIAVIGQSGSGKSEIGMLLARLVRPTGGRITIGGHNLADTAGRRGRPPHRLCRRDAVSVRRQRCATICCSVCATGRCGRPNTTTSRCADGRAQLDEARRSGNIDFDLHADWVDYEGAGVADATELSARIREVLARLDFEEDVYDFGLRWRLDPAEQPELAERLLEARRALAERLADEGITKLVETYDPERYNTQRDGRREPAVRHPDRAGLRVRGARRQRPTCWRCSTRSG